MKRILAVITLIFTIVLLAGCQNQEKASQSENQKVQVMATFYPMYAFSKAVVGETGEVKLMIPAGTEPHDYEPSARDIAKLNEAGLVVYNSSHFETWMADVKQNIDAKHTQLVEASTGIQLLSGEEEHEHHDDEADEHNHDHGDVNPHAWLDPVLAQKEVSNIQKALSKRYPKYQATFEKNAQAYIKKLQALDQQYREAAQKATNKTFVVQHDAFVYLAKRYGLEQVAVTGLSPEEEPTPSRLAELKKYIQKEQIHTIYFEENASAKVAKTLAKETGVRLLVLNPLESLTKDQLADGEDYLSVMQANLQALQQTLNEK